MNTLEYSSIGIKNIRMRMHVHYEVTISMAYITKQHAIMVSEYLNIVTAYSVIHQFFELMACIHLLCQYHNQI